MTAIELVNIGKQFGTKTAVKTINLEVLPGEIFGFVGPNGSGKTTTIKMIAGLLVPTTGTATILGYSVRESPLDVKRLIGYMPDQFGVYPNVSVYEYLDFFSACYRMEEKTRKRLINELLDLVDLTNRRNDRVDQLSQGFKQRLSLARALIHDPKVLLLDEPAAGLDPRARVEIRALLTELSRMGKTVFFSSHILSDVAEIASRIGIIESGSMAVVGHLEELKLRLLHIRKMSMVVLNQTMVAEEFIRNHPCVSNIETEQNSISSSQMEIQFEFTGDDLSLSSLLTEIIHAGVQVLRFTDSGNNLEDIFLQTTGEITA